MEVVNNGVTLKRFNLVQKVMMASALIILGVLALSVSLSSGSVRAAVDSGGDPAGGGGGHQAVHGYGWRVYDVNGSGPNHGLRSGVAWSEVQRRCAGSLSVVGFVVLDGDGNHMIYTWPSWTRNYVSGNGFIPISDALSYYETVPATDKDGFTWGANVGWFCYGDAAKEWSVSGASTIQIGNPANRAASVGGEVTAAPGNRLNWFHHLYNNGPEAMDRQIEYSISKSGFSNGWNGIALPSGWRSGAAYSHFVTEYASNSASYTLYDVRQEDVGNKLCQRITWSDKAWNDAADDAVPPACADIPYNYSLIPTITNITDGQMREAGEGSVPVQGSVSNNSVTKSHTNITWQITQIRYERTATIPNKSGGGHPNNPCTYFDTNGAACSVLSSGVRSEGYGHNQTVAHSATGRIGDEEVGARICYAMSVKRGSSANEDWRHSGLYCFTVGKKPKVQVNGGDVIVGRGHNSTGTKIVSNVTTSTSNKDGTYYGSWGEYAIIPSGKILGMASASGYTVGRNANTFCNNSVPLHLLSFTNAHQPNGSTGVECDPDAVGNYRLASLSPLYAAEARFTPAVGAPTVSGNINVTDLASGTVYKGSGSINLSASTEIPAGKWVIIHAPTVDVRITSDIRYFGGLIPSVGSIPQLVIIARNIVIDDSVENIDAWLFAKGVGEAEGVVNTCDSDINEPSELTSDVCSRKLTVNGPVVSNKLLLYRTHGSGIGAESGVPAEVFNLRPDAYMWASAFSGVGIKAHTVVTTELPPRF